MSEQEIQEFLEDIFEEEYQNITQKHDTFSRISTAKGTQIPAESEKILEISHKHTDSQSISAIRLSKS